MGGYGEMKDDKNRNCKMCENYKKHKIKLHRNSGWHDMYVCEAVYECDYKPKQNLEADNECRGHDRRV